MGLNNKIEEIRQKPEHVRERYVWFSVAVSMIFIIIIWVFSLQSGIEPIEANEQSSANIQKQLQELRDNTPSINELLDTAKSAQENLSNTQIQENYQSSEIEDTQEQVDTNENKLPTNNEFNKPEINGEKPAFPPKE